MFAGVPECRAKITCTTNEESEAAALPDAPTTSSDLTANRAAAIITNFHHQHDNIEREKELRAVRKDSHARGLEDHPSVAADVYQKTNCINTPHSLCARSRARLWKARRVGKE